MSRVNASRVRLAALEASCPDMLPGVRGNIHTTAGVMASCILNPQYFRFCPDCLQEDFDRYGETYWHRLHQIQGEKIKEWKILRLTGLREDLSKMVREYLEQQLKSNTF